jgi:DNA-directed RNA polymerase subunit RPC12/RpoP
MVDLQEFKCPCCGGSIEFNSETQKMQCPYCDTEFDVEALKGYEDEAKNQTPDEMEWETSAGSQWQDGETDGLRIYVCKSCGGEIVGDETLGAASCPYCDNPVVMSGQFSGSLKPDYVIPFKKSKEDAKKAMRQHTKGKRLLPKVFKDENHIEEIKGVYVPFWLFDADADANIRYKATKIHTWSDSNYYYTRTSYFAVHRSGSIGFERVPVDGSTKMADDLMESIEPYDFADAVDFKTAYLSGYLADKYDVDANDSITRANQRIKNSTEQAFAETVNGYSSVVPESSTIKLSSGKARYALYPVWLLNTNWKGQKYVFAMNGQTGKFVGNLPLDKAAYKKWLFGLAGAISAAAFALSFLLWWIF